MEKHVEYYERLIDSITPRWESCLNEANLAKFHGDMETFRQLRTKLGAISMCTMYVIKRYQEVFNKIPDNLKTKTKDIVEKLEKETNIKVTKDNFTS